MVQIVQTPGNVYLAEDPDTAIEAIHIAIVGDGLVHVTVNSDLPTLAHYDPSEIDRIDFKTG